jgi:hypothetical protein
VALEELQHVVFFSDSEFPVLVSLLRFAACVHTPI